MSNPERGVLMTMGVDCCEARPTDVDAEAAGVIELRDEAGVSKRGSCAKAIRAFPAGDELLAGGESFPDRLGSPSLHRLLTNAKRPQAIENFKILDRMNVAGNCLCEGLDPRAIPGIGRQEWRLRDEIVQILGDRQRLGKHLSTVQLKSRNKRLWIDIEIGRSAMLASTQMMRTMRDNEPFQSKDNSHPPAGARAIIAM